MNKQIIYQEINETIEATDAELGKSVGGFSWHTQNRGINNAASGLFNEIGNQDIGGIFGSRLYSAWQSGKGNVGSGLWDLFNGYCENVDGNHAGAAQDYQNAAGELSSLINGWGEGHHALAWELLGTAYEAAGVENALCGNYAAAQADFHNAVSNFDQIVNTVGNKSCESWENIAHAYDLEAHAYKAEGNYTAAAHEFKNAVTNYASEVNIGGNHSASVFNDLGGAYADEAQALLETGHKNEAARDYYLAANNYDDAGNITAEKQCIADIRKIG